MRLVEDEKLMVEPSGAVAVAALVRHLAAEYRGRKVVCVVSGADATLETLCGLKNDLASLPVYSS